MYSAILNYGSKLWDAQNLQIRDIMLRSQNKCLRIITNAHRYTTKADLHRDLKIEFVEFFFLGRGGEIFSQLQNILHSK